MDVELSCHCCNKLEGFAELHCSGAINLSYGLMSVFEIRVRQDRAAIVEGKMGQQG